MDVEVDAAHSRAPSATDSNALRQQRLRERVGSESSAPACGSEASTTPVIDIMSMTERVVPRNQRVQNQPQLMLNRDSVRALQRRLNELGHCVEETGTYDSATRKAVQDFQFFHRDEISRIQEDASQDEYNQMGATYTSGTPIPQAELINMSRGAVSPFGSDGTPSGQIRNNDATHQALANAYPRRLLGELIETPVQAMELIRNRLDPQNDDEGIELDFSPGTTNVVGVRGLSGGQESASQGRQRFSRNERYDDTLFVIRVDNSGEVHVDQFRATVDPGTQRNPNSAFQVQSGQQWDYRLATMAASQKFGRPALWPMMNREGEPNVTDVDREGLQNSVMLQNQRGYEFSQDEFFAMHSGGSGAITGDRVFGDSTGCQVVHGAWYGHYIETLRRGLAGDDATTHEQLPESGRIRYTLVDASALRALEGEVVPTEPAEQISEASTSSSQAE